MMAEDEGDPFLGGLLAKNPSLLPAALFGTAYAAWLATEDGKAWIDENTTLGVVVGGSGVLATLRLTLPGIAWRHVVGAFLAAGVPLVVRGLARKLGG